MKLFFVIYLVVSPLVLCKESVNDLVQLLEDPKVLIEIVKRLGSDESDEKSVAESRHNLPNQNTGSLNNCKFNNFTRTIIQTKASTTAGAVFLDSVNGLESNSECVGKCCELDGCELAVYENKGDRFCYLFRCKDVKTGENYCEFANHDDYISTSISHNIFFDKATENNNDHENDLHDLSDGSKESSPPTTPSTTTTTTTTPAEPEQPYSIVLGGKCRSKYGCEDSHAMCLSGTCLCKSLYYNKKGTCREVCGHSRFECQVVDLDGPDCVRLSLVCDGTNDCHDGSDEVKCQTEGHEKNPNLSTDSDYSSETGKKKEHALKTPSITSVVESKHTKTQSVTDSSQESSQTSNENNPNDVETDVKLNSEESNSTETSSSEENITDNDNEGKQNVNKNDAETVKNNKNTKLKDQGENNGDNITIEENESFIITKEKVIITGAIRSAQGPIIALSLGLALTFLLLVFIGCRLRNMKRRLRKGRVLHSNEADYLINGMYL